MQTTNEQVNRKNDVVADAAVSVCNMMNNITSRIIEKIESEMPPLFQGYSNLYARYLHSIKDMYGACNMAEKQYFEKMNINQDTLKVFDWYLRSSASIVESNINMFTGLAKSHLKFRLSFVDLWDKQMHSHMDMYTKTFSELIQKKDVSR